jgi:hypothetical protein
MRSAAWCFSHLLAWAMRVTEASARSGPAPLAVQMNLVVSEVIFRFVASLRLSTRAKRFEWPTEHVRSLKKLTYLILQLSQQNNAGAVPPQ